MGVGNLLTQNKHMFSAIIVLSRYFTVIRTHFDFYSVNRYRTYLKHEDIFRV